MSPVIARRKADQAAQFAAVMASNPQGPPVFNISLGNDFASMFQPQPPALPPPPALPALPVQPPPPPPPPSSTLIPVNQEPGTDMPFSDFCRQYGLSSNVLDKLIQNSFNCTRSLRFTCPEDLKEIGFLLGEVAEMKDAVEQWSVPCLQ